MDRLDIVHMAIPASAFPLSERYKISPAVSGLTAEHLAVIRCRAVIVQDPIWMADSLAAVLSTELLPRALLRLDVIVGTAEGLL